MLNKLSTSLFVITLSLSPLAGLQAMSKTPSGNEANAATGKPVIGQQAPHFEATDINGKKVSIKDNKGKVIVLSWFSKKCPFDVKHHKSGNMQKLQAEAAEKGVVWISIISSGPGKSGHETTNSAKEVVKAEGIKAAHLILDPDGTIGKQYDAKTTPHMFIIKTDGTVGYDGAIDSIKSTDVADVKKADPLFKNALEAILAGKTPENAKNAPYGCSVKYKDS